MAIKVGINGFGRIGRNLFRAAMGDKEIEIVAVNDITSPDALAYLLKHDSVLGGLKANVGSTADGIVVDGHTVRVFKERDPGKIDWPSLGVEVVVESTGLFTNADDARKHMHGTVRKVIISAPAKNEDITICIGVNDKSYDHAKHHVISNASCTTNCLSPVAKVIHETFGIERGLMTTIHSYTNDQKLLDLPHSDMRRARAAALSMIPTSTGAAKAIGLVLPALKAAAEGPMKGIMQYTEEELVSIDFLHNPHSSIVDAPLTKSLGENFIKVFAWYDNEWGFSCRMQDMIKLVGKK